VLNKTRNTVLKVTCRTCDGAFSTFPCLVKAGRAKYCSKECFRKAMPQIHKSNYLSGRRKKIRLFGTNNPNWRGRSCKKKCPVCEKDYQGVGKTCSDKCGHRLQGMSIRQSNNPVWKSTNIYWSRNYRKLIAERLNACEVCGNSKKVIAHHIDGNRKHNHRDNLKALCHWCHVIVHYLDKHKQRLTASRLEELSLLSQKLNH
jgi:hypothetical protein